MELKLGNVVAIVFILVAIRLYFVMRPEVMDCINATMKTSPGNPAAVQLQGTIALGLILLAFVGAIKLVIAERDKK